MDNTDGCVARVLPGAAMSRLLWTIQGWKEVLQRRRKNGESELAESGGWTEEQWQAAGELSRERFERSVAAQPDFLVFNESELMFASFDICVFLGVDLDEDETSITIEEILKSRGRTIRTTSD
jgi:hypothetical protein